MRYVIFLRKRGMRVIAGMLLVALISAAANAGTGGWLVQGGTISVVESTSGNSASFAIIMPTGTFYSSTCKTGGSPGFIQFLQSDAPDSNTFERAYTIALIAQQTGSTVSVYSYLDETSCYHAGFIQIGQ